MSTHDTEEFRIIPEFPAYRISNFGRVQTSKGPGNQYTPHRVWPWTDMKILSLPSGHCYVRLRHAGKNRFRYIHRLVLEAFVGPCPPGMECCHNDGNPGNNHIGNLRWDTHLENVRDIKRQGRKYPGEGFSLPPEKHGMVKLKREHAVQIRCRRLAGERLRILAAEFGITETQVSRIARGQCWKDLAQA